ncbi:MAG: OmpH family outer membrane protein [Planctomycetota bacterium]|nr:OmpH family outer membrane protein [Planctomycetota bacterium]
MGWRWGFILLCGGVLFFVLPSLFSQGRGELKIGVVDMERISKGYEKWQKCQDELMEEEEKYNKYLEGKQQEVQKKMGRLEERARKLSPSSQEYFDTMEEVEQLKFEFQAEQKRAYNAVKMKAEEMARRLLSDIEAAVEEYGKQYGFSAIFRKENVAVEKLSWTEIRGYAGRKFVLYADRG